MTKRITMMAFALAAIAMLGTACTPSNATVFIDASKTAKKTLTAYYNTHELDPSKPLADGLTIPVVYNTESGDNPVFGHLIATGKVSDFGCQVFNSIVIESGYYNDENYSREIDLCP